MKRLLGEDEARGMTVNGRLFASGLFDDFDEAVARGDVSELKRILRSKYLEPESVRAVIKQVPGTSEGAA